MHTVICKLNKDARSTDNSAGKTFFVSLGEQNYNYKTKQKEWTNYEAALFAKGGQIDFYESQLKKGAIVAVSGKGLIVENDPQYGVKLHIQGSELVYSALPATGAPQEVQQQVGMAPPVQRPPQAPQQPPQAPQGFDNLNDDIPF